MAKPKGTATPNEAKPLLDLSTLDKVEFIFDIDGKRHELVNLDALPIRPRTRIAELFARCLELIVRDAQAAQDSAARPLKKKEERELALGIRALVPMLVPTMTPAIIARHKAQQLQEIILAFFVVRSESASRSSAMERMAVVANSMMQSRQTGASGFRVSSVSTAGAASRPGTSKSRRASSVRV